MNPLTLSLAFFGACVLTLVLFGYFVTRPQNTREARDLLRDAFRTREFSKLSLRSTTGDDCELVFIIGGREFVAAKKHGWQGIEHLPIALRLKELSWGQFERGGRLLGEDTRFRLIYFSPECWGGPKTPIWTLEPRKELWAEEAAQDEGEEELALAH